jgi:uncharacterized ferritin-like protein (DUF455 family)
VTCLFDAAKRCLDEPDPQSKVALTQKAAVDFFSKNLKPVHFSQMPDAIGAPGRPLKPVLVDPKLLPHRGMGSMEGRACFLHAIAHIEFNAINLAWDAIYRFRDMPAEYYADFVQIAADESRHFVMLNERMQALGVRYGDYAAHNNLWEMAEKTAHSCLARMALVPRVLEARGLDVTPGMIARLRSVGDAESADVLDIILREEIPHVAAGSRWFLWCCEREQLEPISTFRTLIYEVAQKGSIRGPYNHPARLEAGFDADEMQMLEDFNAQVNLELLKKKTA